MVIPQCPDIFLVKYNSSGTKQWTKQLGTSSHDGGNSVTTDSSGNIYVTGYTQGGLDGNTSSGHSDIFLIYVTGYTQGGLDGNTNYGNDCRFPPCSDIVLVKYNSYGTKQWTKQLGTSSDDRGNSVTTDSSGNIYVTGYTEGGLDGNTNSGGWDIFLIKFNSSGTKQ